MQLKPNTVVTVWAGGLITDAPNDLRLPKIDHQGRISGDWVMVTGQGSLGYGPLGGDGDSQWESFWKVRDCPGYYAIVTLGDGTWVLAALPRIPEDFPLPTVREIS